MFNRVNQLRTSKPITSLEWLVKNRKIIVPTLKMFQVYYNTQGKAFRKPESPLDKSLAENMQRLGMEIN